MTKATRERLETIANDNGALQSWVIPPEQASEILAALDAVSGAYTRAEKAEAELRRVNETIAQPTMHSDLVIEIHNLKAENAALIRVLRHHGFRECDTPACNCDSWHHVDGLAARYREVQELLEEAGHPVCNDNGHRVHVAMQRWIAETAALRKLLDLYRTKRAFDIEMAEAEMRKEPPNA